MPSNVLGQGPTCCGREACTRLKTGTSIVLATSNSICTASSSSLETCAKGQSEVEKVLPATATKPAHTFAGRIPAVVVAHIVLRPHTAAQAKVGDFADHPRTEQDITGGQVAVDEIMRAKVGLRQCEATRSMRSEPHVSNWSMDRVWCDARHTNGSMCMYSPCRPRSRRKTGA